METKFTAAMAHTMTDAQISIDTRAYELNHGAIPRGRGSWAFYFDEGNDAPVERAWFAPGSLTFSEAKRAAIAEGKRRGATFATVGT